VNQVHHLLFISPDRALIVRLCEALEEGPFLGRALSSRRDLDADLIRLADIVLVDEALGAVDSWSVAREIQDRRMRPIAVIGLVAQVDMATVSNASRLGLAGFLRKDQVDDRLVRGLSFMARNVRLRDPHPSGTFVDLRALREPLRGRALGPTPPPAGNATAAEEESTESSDDTLLLGQAELQEAFEQSLLQAPDLSGLTLGKVRLERLLGKGGGGVVYLGTHLNLHMPVAVKVLHADLAEQDTEFALAFLEEARVAARVSHANVVRVLDCERDDEGTGAYHIVMEYVEGRSLEDDIRQSGRIGEHRLLGIAIGIAHALVAAAQAGIIHRDIKPANVMLDEEGTVKVADLGLAKRSLMLPGLATATELRTTLMDRRRRWRRDPLAAVDPSIQGTPHYMSPEQISDPESIDIRSDLYSLGATLFHACVGEPPFPRGGIPEILLAHLDDAPPHPRELGADISPRFESIILRLLEKQAERRPSSPRELLSLLRERFRERVAEEMRSAGSFRGAVRRLFRT
jgi:hypothetical protein